MKYAREVLGLMRPYPGRAFRMSQLVREVIDTSRVSSAEVETVRRGIRRVLEDLVVLGNVKRVGGNTKSAAYVWIEKP